MCLAAPGKVVECFAKEELKMARVPEGERAESMPKGANVGRPSLGSSGNGPGNADQFIQYVECSSRGSLLLNHQLPRRFAHLHSPLRVTEQVGDGRFDFVRCVDTYRPARFDEPTRGILEIPNVRSEHRGHAVPGRLDHALPAAFAVERATDVADIGERPSGT